MSSHCVQIARRLGSAARAEVAARAGEREQILLRAGLEAEAGEAVFQHAARDKLLGDLRDDGTSRVVLAHGTVVADCLPFVQVIQHQPQERRRLRASGLVDAARRRGCVGHRRSGTEERRAYA